MGFRPRLARSIQPFPHCRLLARRALASSAALHAVAFALAGWATHDRSPPVTAGSAVQVTRAYALHYVNLAPAPPGPEPLTERRPASRAAPVAPATTQEKLPSAPSPVDPESQTVPHRAALLTQELAPGAIAAVGPSTASSGPDLRGFLGDGPTGRGLDRVPELVPGAGPACPELWRPAAWVERTLAVSVAFVVDTNGAVDPATLRVVESPSQPLTENRPYSHVYGVSAHAPVDPDRLESTVAYDSLLTQEVVSYVAGLEFRPAMRLGRVVRSAVLVSCQSP